MREGENFKLPRENKLRRLNEICAKCRHALRIYEKECPACGAIDISKPIFNTERTPLIEVYFYNCSKCGRHLYSNKFFKFHK